MHPGNEPTPKGVYFIYAPQQDKVKIGRSSNMPARHKQLQTGFMDEGILLCGILTDQPAKLETKLHRKFRHLRVEGEWFILTKELADYIESIETVFQSVVVYSDLKILAAAAAYNNVTIFKYVEQTKKILLKVITPLIFLSAGIIIAYFFSEYNRQRGSGIFYPYGYVFFLIVIPIVTVILPRIIIQYCSTKRVLFYFGLMAANMILAALSLTYLEEQRWFPILQFVALVSYLVYSRQLLLEISLAKNDESRRKKVADAYALDEPQLRSHIHKLSLEAQRSKHIFVRAGIIIGILAYTVLHTALFISSTPDPFKILIAVTLNTGVLLWSAMTYFRMQANVRSYVLPVTIFLIIVVSSFDDRAFTSIFFSLMPSTIVAMAFLLWYSIRKRQMGAELSEVEKRLKDILTDREDQILKLQSELKIIQAKIKQNPN